MAALVILARHVRRDRLVQRLRLRRRPGDREGGLPLVGRDGRPDLLHACACVRVRHDYGRGGLPDRGDPLRKLPTKVSAPSDLTRRRSAATYGFGRCGDTKHGGECDAGEGQDGRELHCGSDVQRGGGTQVQRTARAEEGNTEAWWTSLFELDLPSARSDTPLFYTQRPGTLPTRARHMAASFAKASDPDAQARSILCDRAPAAL